MENTQENHVRSEIEARVNIWPSFGFYVLLSIMFILLTFMTLIAWRNSQPFECADRYVQYVKGTSTCVVPLTEIDRGIK